MIHKHHIVPKHVGGSDDPSNLVELSVEEHAEAHRVLFEQYGRWQDRVAWLRLTYAITHEEARIMAVKFANTGRPNTAVSKALRGVPKTKAHKENLSNSLKGRVFSEASRKKMSVSAKLRVQANGGTILNNRVKQQLS